MYKPVSIGLLLAILTTSNSQAMRGQEEMIDISNTLAHIAIPVRNLDETKAFYEDLFDTELIAYGKSPGSHKKDLALVKWGNVALSFNEVPDLVLNHNFTMVSPAVRSFVPCFHIGLFELSPPQFEILTNRIKQKEVPVIEEVRVNEGTSERQKLMFIKDPNGYVIELRQSNKLTPNKAHLFEQQSDINKRTK